jgi:PAP2 superfamily
MDAGVKVEGKASESAAEVDAAWRFLLFNWIVIGSMATVLALSLVTSNFSIGLAGFAVSVGYVGLYAGFAHANANSPSRRDPQVMFVLAGIAQIVLITAIMTPLTYIAAAIDLPMQDSNLLAVDKMLGFDWAGYVRFINARPALAALLNCGYTMIRWPIFAIPIMLAAKGRYRRIEEFTFAFGMALVVTTIISALVPAIGVYREIGIDPGSLQNIDPNAYLDQLRDLPPTRDGTLRHLDLLDLGGIVTFPSFHAASGILYSWALWPVKWARPIFIPLNALLLAATPANGGHYFIDIIAGVAIAVAAIVAARRVGRLVAERAFGLGPLTPKSAAVATAPAPISAPAVAK